MSCYWMRRSVIGCGCVFWCRMLWCPLCMLLGIKTSTCRVPCKTGYNLSMFPSCPHHQCFKENIYEYVLYVSMLWHLTRLRVWYLLWLTISRLVGVKICCHKLCISLTDSSSKSDSTTIVREVQERVKEFLKNPGAKREMREIVERSLWDELHSLGIRPVSADSVAPMLGC